MWERRYRAAFERLQHRFMVPVVYDAVLAKAQLAAAELRAEAAVGLRQLFERTDLDAVLVLDPAWYDLYPAELACRLRKPVFLAGSLGHDRAALEALHQSAVESETLLMTEFSRRYTPATNRLRELIATRLGEARAVTVNALVPLPSTPGPLPGQDSERDYLAGLLDWCQYITGRVPTQLTATMSASAETTISDAATSDVPTTGAAADAWQVMLGFRPNAQGQPATTARIALQPRSADEIPNPAGTDDEWPFPHHEIVCEHGRAVFSSAGEIHWQNGVSDAPDVERLTSERSDAEVMLDQFSRRILGGLVPVADVQDVCRALKLVEAISVSRERGQPTTLSWS